METTPPTYLQGSMAPVPDEIEAFDLPVTGTLPPELTGRYFRNGPNPRIGEDRGHWFAGHGMLHGIRLADGRAQWYRNRWVRTGNFAGRPLMRPDGSRDLAVVNANTHVIRHADRTLALVESGLPYQVDEDLNTIGPCDFDGALTTPMTAHPKQDPETGELHFFGYSPRAPFLTYHRLSPEGALVETRPIQVPGPTMMHDFAITRHHVVWLDLPVVFTPDSSQGLSVRFDDGYGARIGVMPHGGEVTWFDIDPCYVFHVGNASEDAAGRIVLDAARYSRSAFHAVWNNIGGGDPEQRSDKAVSQLGAKMHRWILDPAHGSVREQGIDDRPVEFPTINNSHVGRPNRYLYARDDTSVVKYDLHTGATISHQWTNGRTPGEAYFVPVDGAAAEDEGWLLTIDGDQAGTGSQLIVLDATDLAAGPVATVTLPRRVPDGFHGSWLAD